MFKPRLGVALKVLTHNLTEEWVEAIVGSRIETLEITPYLFGEDRLGTNREVLKEILGKPGIGVSSVHAKSAREYDFSVVEESAYRGAIEGFGESLDAAVEFGARVVTIHTGHEPIGVEERGARIAQARRGLAEVAGSCKAAGKVIALELLPRTCLGNTVEECLELIDGLDVETFGVCVDVNHLMERVETLPEVVRGLGGRLSALHLSDYDGVDEKHWMPGRGVIEWGAFMEALRDIDYEGPFTYECPFEGETPEEKLACMEENFEWLSGL